MPALSPNYADLACEYNCEIPQGSQMGVVIYLLALLNNMADVTPSALLNAACEYNCEIPPGNQLGVAIYLLTLINGGGGGGGGGGAQILWTYWEPAHVDDNPPPNPNLAYLRKFDNGDNPVTWRPDGLGGGSWV